MDRPDGRILEAVPIAPEVSIIIVTHDSEDNLLACLRALHPTLPANSETIVVNNGGKTHSESLLREFPWIKTVQLEENLGFPGGFNAGLRAARAPLVVELNDDTIPLPGWLDPLIARARAESDLGIVAGIKFNPDGSFQDAGSFFVRWGFPVSNPNESPEIRRDVDHVSTGFLMKREMLDMIGVLDESFRPGYFEDLDICRRAALAGWRVAHEPDSRILHRGSGTAWRLLPGTARARVFHRNRIRFFIYYESGWLLFWRFLLEAGFLARILLTGHVRWAFGAVTSLVVDCRSMLAGRRVRRRLAEMRRR